MLALETQSVEMAFFWGKQKQRIFFSSTPSVRCTL
jgi:hypothetical protein